MLIVTFLIHIFPQEDFECGVCTSGSSCELGWGAKVDDVDKNPFALEVQTVKVDHVDKNPFALEVRTVKVDHVDKNPFA